MSWSIVSGEGDEGSCCEGKVYVNNIVGSVLVGTV